MVTGLRIIRIVILLAVALVAAAGQAFAFDVSNLSITPLNGPLAGGTTITISGDHFTDNAYGPLVCVRIAGQNVTPSITIVNNQTLTVPTPAAAAGSRDVYVWFNSCNDFLSPDEHGTFTYVAAPTVTQVSPNNGTTLGGTSVFITGTDFSTATSVTIGGASVLGMTVVNDTTISATTPGHAAGAADIVVTNAGGTGTGVGLYTFMLPPAPTVTGISPNTGPYTGGTSVTITGTNLGGATAVTIGGNPASFTINSGTQITATTPAGTLGPADVVVTTPSGSGTGTGLYTYVTPAPIVTAISPANGPTGGGTFVTITGNYFTSASSVTIGGNAASFTVISATAITATTPAGSAGAANVVVTTPTGIGTGTGLYTYGTPAPTVTSISPVNGPIAGGTAVTITGEFFTGASSVTIGGNAATGVMVVNDTTITATTPAHAEGAVSVAVTTVHGTGTGAGLFTYTPPPPTVTSISPPIGLTTGGTAVTITGTRFTGVVLVTIGGYAATGVTVVNDTTITATTPAGSAGPADVTVTAPIGVGTGAGLFTYVAPPPPGTPAPTVTAISPTSGTTAGGTPVTITGTDFAIGATSVTIGGIAATGVTVVNATTITATTPAHAAGAVDVVVTTPSGPGTGVGLYTYVTPAPTVTAISPNTGTTLGGTSVTITGTNFTGATSVTIGGNPATSVTVVSATSIAATTPAGSAGAVNVVVTTPAGSGTGTGIFTYVTAAPPTVTAIAPTSGPIAGGTAVTITGTNLSGATSVTIGGNPATFVTVVSATSITATTPAGSAGAADVVVITPAGTGTGVGLFTYVTPAPTVTSVTPTSGTTLGGTSVTITGTNFTGATLVTIGGNSASFTVVNATSITATAPAHAAGAVNVVVTTPAGTGTGTGLYTYVTPAPTVTAINPASGPIAGGTAVTITGTNFITGSTTVTFDGIAPTGLTVVNATTITATTPAHAAGAVNVVVTTPGGADTLTFTYLTPAPTVTAISPNTGPTTGGTAVTITGTNLTGATAVLFGGNNVTSFTVVSATKITATSPAGSLGTVYVRVTTPGGTSAPSMAARFTYAVPADSVKLRALQVAVTPVIAQVSGQAISDAVANAIGVGLSGVPQPLTPNGNGFTYYFFADPDNQPGRTAADGGVRNFVAAPDRSTNRVDDGFSALGYRGTRAPPRPIASSREWLAWIDVRGTGSESHATGNDMKGTQANVVAGLTHKFNPDLLVGILGGYEYFDYSSDALSGRLTGGGWTVGAYLGWRFAPSLRFDAAVARSGIGFDSAAGTATGNFFGSRWLASGGVTGTYSWQRWVFEPSARVYALWENENAYTDSLGTAQTERNFSTGRASGGAKLTYPVVQSATTTIAPYVGLYGDYYFSSDDASTLGLTSTQLLQGWSARVTTGVAMRFDRGMQFSVGGELGGIGGNATIWTWKARGSIPF